jgi:hypothetical protein
MMSSSPTEHYGAIAILLTLIVLLDFHSDIKHKKWPTTILLIDNKEVVKRGNRLNPTFMNVSQYLTHDYDLWLVLSSLQLRLPMNIEFEWIKSHQQDDDDETIKTKIGLNNDVDRLASTAYELGSISPERGSFLSGVVCFHQQGHHVQNIHDAISARESDQRLLEYYQSKGWTMESLEWIDWPHLQIFLKQNSPTARCKILQSMHNWQHTGYQKQQFEINTNIPSEKMSKGNDQYLCPLGCGHLENPFHYVYCQSDQMRIQRKEELTTLTKGLDKLKTAPSLKEAIIEGLQCVLDETEYELHENSYSLLYDEAHTTLL